MDDSSDSEPTVPETNPVLANRSRRRAKRAKPSAAEHYRNAHRLAFAPLTFQGVLLARDNGLLSAVQEAGALGITPTDAATQANLPYYAARVLLEACLTADLVEFDSGRYSITLGGTIMLTDELTRVNMNFVRDVCYEGAASLGASLQTGKPEGLKVFGPWPTIYEGLAHLPENVKKSWFEYDHAYSDRAFPLALPLVMRSQPKRLLDVGGNTGKWALACATGSPEMQVTILDHPGQLQVALQNAEAAGVRAQVSGKAMNLLDHSQAFPGDFDVVWMSQCLDCFPEADIVRLLQRGREALNADGTLYVLEPYWDHQHIIGRDSVIGLSLYFACMANGNSRMYHSDDMRRCIDEAGLTLISDERIGFHTLFGCKPKQP